MKKKLMIGEIPLNPPYKGGNLLASSGVFLKTTLAYNPPSLLMRGLGGGTLLVFLLSIFLFSFFLNSCQDTYGTDPYTKKVPVDPKDTTKHEKIHSKEIGWTFREIAGANQVIEWPSSITFFYNSAMLDTIDGKIRLWLDLEMKANFYVKSNNLDESSSDRVEYLKIKVDSLDITNTQTFSLDNLNQGRYSKIELFNPIDNKRYTFEGKELMTRIRFIYNPTNHKVSGNFIFDFNMINYVKTKQFLGNFSIVF